MRILVTAGEPSGDLHAGHVITALRSRFPDATIEAVGGPLMAAAGAIIRHSITGLSAMGIVEIIDKVPTHYRLLQALRRDFRAKRYDLVITVDYPGFHFLVAEAARKEQIPVLWYIAPQLWAWRPRRARRLGSNVRWASTGRSPSAITGERAHCSACIPGPENSGAVSRLASRRDSTLVAHLP
jgi:lipid-A-disaccharide synthase